MGWLTILGFIIEYGPAVIHLVMEIWDLIHHKAIDATERPRLLDQLRALCQHYKDTKDARPLEVFRQRLRERCHGPCSAA